MKMVQSVSQVVLVNTNMFTWYEFLFLKCNVKSMVDETQYIVHVKLPILTYAQVVV
jgi:hypothetical protein